MLSLSISEDHMADGFAANPEQVFGDFTAEIEAETAPVWDKVKHHVTPLEWRIQAPLISAINRLKREKNAAILAHNYMTPDIFHGVGDFVGDSLALAREAAKSDAADHRPGRRALHGRDQQGAQPAEEDADPGPARPAAAWPPRSPAPTCG
jgi:quinolinate synthase